MTSSTATAGRAVAFNSPSTLFNAATASRLVAKALSGDLVAVSCGGVDARVETETHHPPLRETLTLEPCLPGYPCASAAINEGFLNPTSLFVLVDACPGRGSNPHDPKVRGV